MQDMSTKMNHPKMYFHNDIENITILFENLIPKDTTQFVIACGVIALITILYEALKCVRRYLTPKDEKCFA